MSGLHTLPVEDGSKSPLMRKSSKQAKLSRTFKRSSYVQDHAPVVPDGRHKRVWKACERCRMKKTKCDGESPCKRCKDDGLVCTAGCRKNTEFKQLPRGYAEVLENTQHALIATVQKLYTMVRNNESWDLGDPALNDRGQPVIHDIASQLGCIRPSLDLPAAIPNGAEDFAELQAKLQAAQSKMGAEDAGSRKLSGYSPSSPSLAHTGRASSTESGHSDLLNDYDHTLWVSQQRQSGAKVYSPTKSTPLSQQRNSTDDDGSYLSEYLARASFDSSASIPSPVYTDFPTTSPMFRKAPSFASWSASDDFHGPPHVLDLTAQFMIAQQLSSISGSSLSVSMDLVERNMLKVMQLQDGLNFGDGVVAPHMLDCNGYDPIFGWTTSSS